MIENGPEKRAHELLQNAAVNLRAKTVFLQFLLNRFDLRPKILVVMEDLENPREHKFCQENTNC